MKKKIIDKIDDEGLGKLIEHLKRSKTNVKIDTEPFIVPYLKQKYQEKIDADVIVKQKRRKVKTAFSYSLIKHKCDRHIYYAFFIPPEVKIINVDRHINMDIGTYIHKYYEEFLFPIANLVPVNYEEPYIKKQLKVKGDRYLTLLIRVDAIIEFNNEKRIVDVKTMRSSNFWSFVKKPYKFLTEHWFGKFIYMQAQFYLGTTGLEKHTILAHCKDSSDIREITILKNKEYITKMFNRCKNIYEQILDKDVPKRPFTEKECKKNNCDFFRHCWEKDEEK